MAGRSDDSSDGSGKDAVSVDTLVEGGRHFTYPARSPAFKEASGTTYNADFHPYSNNTFPLDDTPAIFNKHKPSGRRRCTFKDFLGLQSQQGELRSTAWLDGLRGCAALEVFIFHYLDNWADHHRGWGQDGAQDKQWWKLPFIRSIYGSGDTAVCVFFAISGYVLTHKMLLMLRQNRQQELYPAVASAMFRRGIRLYMPVVIETFIMMVLVRIGLPRASVYDNAPTIFGELSRWFWSVIHMLMPLRYPERWHEILNIYDGNITWTIPLEYYGSMVVYATVMFFTRTRNYHVRMSLLATMITTSFLRDDWVGAQFLLGMTFADWQLEQEARGRTLSRARSTIITAMFIFGIYLSGLPTVAFESDYKLAPRPFYYWISQPLAYLGAYQDRKGDRYLTCLAAMCILIGIGETPRLKRVMETRFIQYLGKISFGLYLCHVSLRAWLRPLDIIYFTLVGLDPATARETGSGIRYFVAFCMMMVPSVLVNFAVGSLFEKYLDRMSVNASKRFEQWCLAKE